MIVHHTVTRVRHDCIKVEEGDTLIEISTHGHTLDVYVRINRGPDEEQGLLEETWTVEQLAERLMS